MTLWTTALQASLSVTVSLSLLKFVSIEQVMPSNHLSLCRPLSSCPQSFPNFLKRHGLRVFSSESALRIRWPKYWSFSFSIGPSSECSVKFPLGLTGLISLQSKALSKVFSNTGAQEHQFFSAKLSLWSNSNIHT